MNRLKNAGFLLAALLALTSCTRPVADAGAAAADQKREDELALRGAGVEWNEAFAALDVDAILALYADDAMLMPQTAVAARGREEIRRYLKGYFSKLTLGPYSVTIPAGAELRVSGDLGIRWGPYQFNDGSGVLADTGKWMQAWRKKDGKWQIILQIDNSDQLPLFPPEPAPPTP